MYVAHKNGKWTVVNIANVELATGGFATMCGLPEPAHVIVKTSRTSSVISLLLLKKVILYTSSEKVFAT